MLYASIQVLHRRMLDSTVPTTPTFEVLPVSPDTISDAALAYASAAASVVSTIDVDAFSGTPSYTAPTTSLSALEAFSAFSGTLINLTISATAPTVIIDPVIASPGIATIAKAAIAVDVPTYTKPSTVVTAVTPDAPILSSVGFNESNALNVTATSPGAISLTAVSYTGISDVDASVTDATPTSVNITGATQPAYNGGAVIGMAATTHVLASKEITDLNVTAVTPDTPVIAAIAYALPGTALTAFSVSSIAVPSATIGAPGITAEGVNTLTLPDVTTNVPLYNLDNTIVEFGIGAGQQFAALAAKTIDSLIVTSVAPDTPVIDVVSYGLAGTVTVSGSTNMSVSDIDNSGGVDVASINAADSSQPNYSAPTVTGAASLAGNLETGATLGGTAGENDFGQWFSAVGQYIEDEEDIELANATMQKISTFINAYQVDVQNSLNEFNEDAQIYQQLVQQGTQNANATNQALLNDIQRKLQENQADLQKNQAAAQANMQKDMQEDQINTQNAQAKALQDAQQTVQAIMSS